MADMSIEDAVKVLREEITDAHSVEIRAQEMPGDRQKGVILIWVKDYVLKRQIYEKYGVGDNLFPALFEGWEIRVRKWPPFVSKKKKKR